MIVMPRRLSDEVASRVRALIEEQQLGGGHEVARRAPTGRTARRMAATLLREALAKPVSEGVLIAVAVVAGRLSAGSMRHGLKQNIVQLQNSNIDDPDYSFDILEACHAIEASNRLVRSYACYSLPTQREDQILFRATQRRSRSRLQADVFASHLATWRPRTTWCCYRPCAVSSTYCSLR